MNGEVVIRVVGWADPTVTLPANEVGSFIADFDFEAHKGRGHATFTKDIAKARRFPSVKHAFNFINTVPKCRPKREDGLPNKPMTAMHNEILPLEG